MKKTAIALAVLGTFAGAASAQSSVTLYGRAEANVTYNSRGSSLAGNSSTKMYDGGANTGIGGSRFGFRGIEDLGGGLKAFFVLEAGYNVDSGNQRNAQTDGPQSTVLSDKLFSRLSYIGLSDSWGEVALGRQETVSRQINNVADASGLGEIKVDETLEIGSATDASLTTTSGRVLFQTFNQRVDNALTYTSPSFAGFKARIVAAAGENTYADYYGLQANYSAGPLNVGLGYEEASAVGTNFDSAFNKTFSIGANYNFGVATLYAGYKDTKDVGNVLTGGLTGSGAEAVEDQNAWNVGVMVPFGAWQFRAQYITSDYDLVNGDTEDIQKYGVSARYALSKRTTAYGAWTARDGSSSSIAVYNKRFFAQENAFAVGLAHTF